MNTSVDMPAAAISSFTSGSETATEDILLYRSVVYRTRAVSAAYYAGGVRGYFRRGTIDRASFLSRFLFTPLLPSRAQE